MIDDIQPNDTGLPGVDALKDIVGAVMTFGLILSVLGIIISAVVWGIGANSSNPALSGRGKIGVLICCGSGILTGGAVALISFFWDVGQKI